MNVTRLRLANFKRFTDLTIDLSSCAGAPKLVLLIGANGSGKSSVFDAFEYLSAPATRVTRHRPRHVSPVLSRTATYKGEAYDKFLRYLKKDPATAVSASCSFGGGFEVGRSERLEPRLRRRTAMGREVGVLRPERRCGRCRSFAQRPEAVDAGRRPRSPAAVHRLRYASSTPTSHGSRRTCSGISGARTPTSDVIKARSRRPHQRCPRQRYSATASATSPAC